MPTADDLRALAASDDRRADELRDEGNDTAADYLRLRADWRRALARDAELKAGD